MFGGVEPPPPAPRRRPASENAVTVGILIFALFLLVFPFSADCLVDIIRYLRGH